MAGSFGGQGRIAAEDKAFAGILVRGDFGQVLLVEERQLQGPGLGQGADGRAAQSGDPIEAERPDVVADARGGEQAAVADDHQPLQPEALAQGVAWGAQRAGSGSLAGEDRDGGGAARAVAE